MDVEILAQDGEYHFPFGTCLRCKQSKWICSYSAVTYIHPQESITAVATDFARYTYLQGKCNYYC